MKAVVILAGVAVLIVGVLYYRETQHSRSTSGQLTLVSNALATVRLELTSVKTQMVLRVAELEDTLASEKANSNAKIGKLEDRVKVVEQDLQDEKNKLATVEDERGKVVAQLSTVSNQLTNVRQQLGDLQKTHAATEAELTALRDREEALVMEKASLERQLSDLDALKSQIRYVKRQIWEKHVAEWKRQDELAGVGGNKGVLFQNGQWQAGTKPAS